LFMASAASAAVPDGTPATFICVAGVAGVATLPASVIDAVVTDVLLSQAQTVCTTFHAGEAALQVAGPIGAQGVAGVTGAPGGTGGTGSTGPNGNTGLKGAQGPTGPQGTPGGTGGIGSLGAKGATGAGGPAPTGPTGGNGGSGDTGLVGPQGPSGVVGPTGATALIPGIHPVSVQSGGPNVNLDAGPGKLGNTLTQGGNSQIGIFCPVGSNILGGGAELIDGNADVRGILESSFPDTTSITPRWIITAEVTATGTSADAAATNILTVVPWVSCRA
jgi:hypothetical protein